MTYHPWQALAQFPEWTCWVAPLPAGLLGKTDFRTKTITLARGMTQRQRRCTLAHELQHVERGPFAARWESAEEAAVENAAARRLISMDALLAHAPWARSLWELADELWVDVATLERRLALLHPAERERLHDVVREAHAP